VWEEKLGAMMYGNRALAWSADGRRFAAVKQGTALVLGDLTSQEVRHQSVKLEACSIAFIPESEAVLVGCESGAVVRVNASGATEDVELLRMPDQVWSATFSPSGDRVAIMNASTSGANLKIWSWDSQGPQEILQEEQTQVGTTNPSCAWSPDGRILAWCPGPWSTEAVPNDLYLFSDAGTQCVSAAHENSVNGIAFSPDGRYLITASNDRTIALRGTQTGEAVAPPWNCAQNLKTAVFHPHATLMAAGGSEGVGDGLERDSRLYLLRFAQADLPQIEAIQENDTETAVLSLAFSPDGQHLLMGTYDRLSLFRVHLI
jgi:WD40 repeat protein